MKLRIVLLSLTVMVCSEHAAQVSPHVISFFIKPLPIVPAETLEKVLQEQVEQPTKPFPVLSTFAPLPYTQSGMYAVYTGLVTHSKPTGQIVFERKSPEPQLQLLVTNAITPIHLSPASQKTLHGFVVNPGAEAQQYQFERLQDPETETYFWQVTSVPVDPERRIPYDTIILYANPKNVIIPLGPTATKFSENFLLPDIYVTQGYNSALNALLFLKVRHFFAPELFTYAYLPQGFQQMINLERS